MYDAMFPVEKSAAETIIEQGEEFHESLPINQVGQLVGAAAVGGGLALLGVAAASRRHRRSSRVKCVEHLP